MGRKNNNAGQPNRTAQMQRRARHLAANESHKPQRKTREDSMRAHPAGKGLNR